MYTRKETFLVIILFLAVAFVCYGNSLGGKFIWDDESLIVQNPLVRAPLWSFHVFKEDIINSGFTYTIYYRPIQILTYAIDHRFWGMNPFGFHITSVLIHSLNGFLIFILSRNIMRSKMVPFFAGVIFIVHPMFAGAVAYISGRADLLLFFFGFLSTIFFVFYRKDHDPGFLLLSGISLVLALLSKEMAVVVPLLIILVDVFFIDDKKEKVICHLPNMAILGAYGVIHHLFFKGTYSTVFNAMDSLNSLMAYFKMSLDLFVSGLFPLGSHMRHFAGDWRITALGAVVLALVVYAFWRIKNSRKEIVFSILYFLIALFPLVFVVKYFNVFAEHWMYLAGYGLFLFEAIVIDHVYKKGGKKNIRIAWSLFFALILFYSLITLNQNRYWHSNVALSNRVLGFSKQDQVAMHYKAASFIKDKKTQESLDIMKEYVEINSKDPRAWFVKGRLELVAGNLDAALADFRRSLELAPSYDNGYFGVGLVLVSKKETAKGIENLEKAISINPRNMEALEFLSTVYSRSGDISKALLVAKKAKKQSPYDYDVMINLGTILVKAKDTKGGAMEYLEASELYPERPLAYYNLAYLFYKSGDKKSALGFLEKALQKDPSYRPALELLHEINK